MGSCDGGHGRRCADKPPPLLQHADALAAWFRWATPYAHLPSCRCGNRLLATLPPTVGAGTHNHVRQKPEKGVRLTVHDARTSAVGLRRDRGKCSACREVLTYGTISYKVPLVDGRPLLQLLYGERTLLMTADPTTPAPNPKMSLTKLGAEAWARTI